MLHLRSCGLLATSMVIAGCGTYVPKISKFKDDQLYTIDVHRSIQCEIIDAVHLAYKKAGELKNLRGTTADFFRPWGIKYALTLNVVEDSSINPSIDVLNPATPLGLLLPGTSVLTLNTGIKLTTKATTTQTDQKFNLVETIGGSLPCRDAPKNRIVALGDNLRIKSWMLTRIALVDSGFIDTLDPKESFTHEVKFEIGKRGNVDPRWTFLQHKFNKAGGLFNAGRTRNHSVLITFGPVDPSRKKLALRAESLHNARLFGNAVSQSTN